VPNHTSTTISAPVITGGTWSAAVDGLVEGENIIAVTETDPLGAVVASVSATIILDTHSPDLTVDTVLGTKNSFKAIGGTVDDPPYHFVVKIDVNCPTAVVEMATVAVPAWSAMIRNLTSGNNLCTVTATDWAGNHASKSVNILFDDLIPDLDFHIDGPVKFGAVLIVSGTVESGIVPEMKVNGVANANIMTANGTTWTTNVSGLVEGDNTITVTATDSIGNVNTKTTIVTVVVPTGSFSGAHQPMIEDALKALRMAAGFVVPTKVELLRCDLFEDGVIDLADALLILRKVAGF
jgi:hypothetical protein